jgi:peptidoglycan/LPS O-acetylase OafA/YrhL
LVSFPLFLGGIISPQYKGSKSSRLPSLDGLRAISIMLVLTSHSILGTHSFAFRLLFLHADLGVRVFFVISGFLITTLLLNERAESGGISLRLFYIRRTLRILPAFYLFVGTVAILTALRVIDVPGGNWIYVLTYTMNFNPHPPWVLGHLWSLSVEEQFYLLWPLAVKFLRPRVWAIVAALSVFGGFAIRALGLIDPALHYAFPFVCGPLAMGCLLAIYAPRVRAFIASSRFLSGDLVFVCAVPLILWLDTVDMGTVGHSIGLITNTLLTFCVARLVFVPAGLVGRVLNSAPLVRLGKLSYSLYLFQQLFFDSISGKPSIPLPFPFNLVGAFGAALACYYAVEAPFLALRGRFRARAFSAPASALETDR